MGVNISEIRATVQSEKKKSFLQKDIPLFKWRFSDKKKASFYSTVAVLLEAGLDTKSAFELYAEEQRKKKDAEFIRGLTGRLVAGSTLANSAAATNQFSSFEIESLRIGEASGRLTDVMNSLSEHFERRIKIRRLLTKVLAYPAFVAIVSVVVIWFMMLFVVPMFANVFTRFDAELPGITKMVVSLSNWIAANVWKLVLGFLLIVGIFYWQRKMQWSKKLVSRLTLSIPLFGPLISKVYQARFCQSMHLLVETGSPITKAISMTTAMIEFHPMQVALKQVEAEIITGKPLHQAMKEHKIFDHRLISLVKVGEQSGQLPKMFAKLSDQLTQETEHKSSILSALLEPALIVFIALLVGFILIAMYMPLFELGNVIK